jgi:DNA-binding XRE family transcriptional regulator
MMREKEGIMLKTYRKKAGLTQAALGAEVGVGQAAINNYESFFSVPSLKVAIAIMDALKKRKIKMDVREFLPPVSNVEESANK